MKALKHKVSCGHTGGRGLLFNRGYTENGHGLLGINCVLAESFPDIYSVVFCDISVNVIL